VIRAIRRGEIIKSYPVRVIRTTDYTNSFSFFSYVFVNPSITDVETEEIVNHELVHISQYHWFDLVLVELLCILQWFNPLVWIYVRFMRQNHEYLADEVALQRTSDPAIYKAALLNQIVGSPVVSLANSFNYSLNSKRFKMMKNIINSPYRKMKILFILPVFAIVLYSFAKPEYRYASLNDKQGNNDPVASEQKNGVKGYVVQEDGKPLEGAAIILAGTTEGTISDAKGNFRLENVPDGGDIIVSFVGFETKVIKPVFNSEMKIKMKISTIGLESISTMPPPPPPPPPAGNGNSFNAPPPPPPPTAGNGSNLNAPPPPPPINNVQNTDKNQFVVVEEMPEFPGGNEALKSYILQNLKYPVEAAQKKIEGRVVVRFLIDKKGKTGDLTILKSDNSVFDDEAKRVISSMPDWKPASQSGKTVDVYFTLPLDFKLR
jgi:TonB family protein